MKSRLPLLLLPIIMLLHSCASTNTQTYDFVITNAHVVDVTEGRVLENRTVVINNGIIEEISEGANTPYRASNTLDAQGRYLIPGLWDNHIHLRGGEALIEENRNLLPLFIAHGVTSVRDAGGDLYPAIKEWQSQIEAGTLTGPRILTAGPKLDGPNPTWEGSIEVATPAEVPAAMDSLQKLGVDFVKIYDSTITGEVFLEIVREAEKRGMQVSGHMPFTITLEQTMELGLDATEHMYYVFKAASAKVDSITQAIQASQNTAKPIGFAAALRLLYPTYSQDKAQEVFRKMAATNTAVVPTLHISRVLNNLQQDDHTQDEYLPYIGEGIIKTYERRINSAMRQPIESVQFMRDLNALFHTMVPQMQQAGVTILAGSDCGAYNSYVYPGISLHRELELMVEAGLTPAQALRTATVNGAQFMGKAENYGTVESGKVADLVLLEQNPLENISNTQRIHTVIFGGKTLSKEELQQQLEALRRQ